VSACRVARYSGLLHELGKITLETYLMQHHVWLTSNAKTLLVITPGYPKINLLAASLLYLFVSKQVGQHLDPSCSWPEGQGSG
jgi:hypothetical protein